MPDQTKVPVRIFIAMNENEDCGLGFSADEAAVHLQADYGGIMRRIVVTTVHMSPPQITDAGDIDIPDDAGETTKVEDTYPIPPPETPKAAAA
jgi:hypothetical protein